jgi:hypothetical protein
VMLSRHAVKDIHQNFPLAICGHVHPPYIQIATFYVYDTTCVKLAPILRTLRMMSSYHIPV